MAFKKATFKIGTCSSHGQPWDISSVGKPIFFVAHMVGKDELAWCCARFSYNHYKNCGISCFARANPCPYPLALQFLCCQINILLLVNDVCKLVDVIANITWVDLVSWATFSCGVALIIRVQVKDGLYCKWFPMDMFFFLMIEVFKCLHQ